MSSPIPAFYRICFTILDPLLAGFGVYSNIFDARGTLSRFTPEPLDPPTPETTVVLFGMAGFFAMLVVLEGVLLRARPNDMVVWRCVQVGVLFQDLSMIAGFLVEMNETRRLDTKLWISNDWANMTIYAAIAAVRSSFIFGLGVSGNRNREAKTL